MIVRTVSAVSTTADDPQLKAASEVFFQTQQEIKPPYGIVLQADHSRLAGEIATFIMPDVFGTLPAEVVRANRSHHSEA
jgi:hypothetical protein